MDFDRQEIVAALSEVGELLFERRKIGDIAVFGGSAMILQFDLAFITHDVDAVIGAEHGEVTRAVAEVARRRGWRGSWLNEGVSIYLSSAAHQNLALYGDFPSPERVGLRVYVARPQYLLALKLRALRVGSRDLEDVKHLMAHLGVGSVDELVEVVARNFPNEPLDARKRLILADLVAARG